MQRRCDELGVTNRDLARLTGMNPAQISVIRNGKTNTSVQVLAILCDALDVSADYLLGRSAGIASTPDTERLSHVAGTLVQMARLAELLRETADLVDDMIGTKVRTQIAAEEAMAETEDEQLQPTTDDNAELIEAIRSGAFSNIDQLTVALEWDRSRVRKALQRLTSTNRVRYEKREAFQQPGTGAAARRWIANGQYVVVEEKKAK